MGPHAAVLILLASLPSLQGHLRNVSLYNLYSALVGLDSYTLAGSKVGLKGSGGLDSGSQAIHGGAGGKGLLQLPCGGCDAGYNGFHMGHANTQGPVERRAEHVAHSTLTVTSRFLSLHKCCLQNQTTF